MKYRLSKKEKKKPKKETKRNSEVEKYIVRSPYKIL